ncbi:MAG TPA: hypothetical protein VG757_15525 [Devosia sp.]|nr:hypothetical protein [Devosia sp.]
MNWLDLNGAWRLPQAGAGFKALALLVGMLAAGPALAQDEDNRGPLFVCGTGADAAEGTLYLSGLQADDGSFSGLRFDILSGETASYSFAPADPKAAFLFSHSDGPEGYFVTLRFADQGRDYELYSLATPAADPDNDEDLGGYSAGLTVSENGAPVEQIACAERPYMFGSYIRDAVGCDEANPLGTAACAEEPPVRTAPLSLEGLSGQG